MTKRVLFPIFGAVLISFLLGSCHQKTSIPFHPFGEMMELTYDDLVEAGFYRLPLGDDLFSRFDGNKQLTFSLKPSDCVPNIMNNGMNCSDYKLIDRTFCQYFDQFDSATIVNAIHTYGGNIQGHWRKDYLEGEMAGDWQREWYFPIHVNDKRFMGAVMVRETGLTALTITTERNQEGTKYGPSIEYSIRSAARQLLSDNWE